MTRRKGKSVSFDAMVKFFIHNYNIPTKKDIDKLAARLDRIELLLRSGSGSKTVRAARPTNPDTGAPVTALETVYDIIRQTPDGASFDEIQSKTGYGDKKIRNVIFRLHKMGRIQRKSRGLYIVS